jgi:hypothetical protein
MDGMTDGGTDGWLPPDATAGWRSYTELPNCNLEVALDPIKSASKISWVACPGNNGSCLQIDTKGWEGPNSVVQITFAHVSPKHDYLALVHAIPQGFEQSIYSMPSYTPIQAWHVVDKLPLCAVLPMFGPNKAALLQNGPSMAHLAGGAMPTVFTGPTYLDLIPAIAGDQNPEFSGSISDTTVAFDIQPNGQIARLPLGQGNYIATKGIKLAEPIVVGDDVYAYNEYGTDGWSGIARVNADGSTTPYRYVTQRHVSAFRADTNWAVWLETYGDSNFSNWSQPTAELWGAPYTNDPSKLAATAKKLATLPGVRTEIPEPVYSEGYYAVAGGVSDPVKPTVYVVRVADGMVKTIDANALVGPDNVHPYYLSLTTVSQTEVYGIINQVNWTPRLGFVRLDLGSW